MLKRRGDVKQRLILQCSHLSLGNKSKKTKVG